MARQMAGMSPTSRSSPSRQPTTGLSAGCDDDFEFAFGLDLILDGLERRREAKLSVQASGPDPPSPSRIRSSPNAKVPSSSGSRSLQVPVDVLDEVG